MRAKIRLFAVCRERAGTPELFLDFPGDSTTLGAVKSALKTAHPALEALLPITRIAVNQDFADDDAVVVEGDEIALIPPVSGGSGQGPFGIRTEALALTELETAVQHPSAGAVVTFIGTVRAKTGEHEVEALEYEAYPEMAEAFLRKIGGEINERWPGTRVSILHRVGRLSIGEISVAIAVASPHRVAAFEGCRHAIERIKEDVPIWKKELRRDGSVWVGVGS